MKIGFLSHAGASVYHFRMPIIKALLARGDDVFVVVPNDEYANRLQKLNLPFTLVFYELQRSSVNPFVVFKNFFSLYKTLKGLNLDLLQTNAHKSNTLGIIAAKFAGIKRCVALVEGLGSFYIDEDFKSKIVRFSINSLYKIAFKCADKFICVSHSNAEFLKNLGLKEEKITLISSVGVNLKHFCPLKITSEQRAHFCKQNGIKSDLPIVLMVARALWHKGVREFYEAASLLKGRASFIFVGGFDENKSCASLEFLQGGAVHYLGKRDDIAFLLNLCDIFALPSYKEGFPQSVLEAKACAKACVVSEVEGCVEAVRNALDGLYCKVRDGKDLSQKIALLLDDKALLKNLSQNAFKDALNYDENAISAKYLQVYDTLFKAL